MTLSVRPHLKAVCAADFSNASEQLNNSNPTTLIVNSRIVPTTENFAQLDSFVQQTVNEQDFAAGILAVDQTGHWVVAAVATDSLKNLDSLDGLPIDGASDSHCLMETFCFPHDIIRFNQKYFNANLESIVQCDDFKELEDGVFAKSDVKLSEHLVFDTSSGPVVFDDGCSVGPYSYFEGPVYVGPSCKVLEHASIKDYVCLTNTVKAGGEIEASIIEPFSNKQHHGFLGHSYLGSWINIGAGTCNSDLKNTYGKVNIQYSDGKVSTDLQFVGCFVGDYSKTAINTSIFTGKLIGVCSMLYGFVVNNVPDFVNYAATFDQITEVPADVMITTQKRMFARRKIEHRECDAELIRAMHHLTEPGRAGLSLSIEPPKF